LFSADRSLWVVGCDLLESKSHKPHPLSLFKPPLKGGRFDIHFHRRDAEHAEDLFNFLLSAETRLTRLSPPASQALRAGESNGGQGAASKNQQPLWASTCYCQ
jgi:hypothetical protein